jgi:hypothetical protein
MKLLGSGAQVRVVYLSIQDGDFTRSSRKEEIARSLERMGVTNNERMVRFVAYGGIGFGFVMLCMKMVLLFG